MCLMQGKRKNLSLLSLGSIGVLTDKNLVATAGNAGSYIFLALNRLTAQTGYLKYAVDFLAEEDSSDRKL